MRGYYQQKTDDLKNNYSCYLFNVIRCAIKLKWSFLKNYSLKSNWPIPNNSIHNTIRLTGKGDSRRSCVLLLFYLRSYMEKLIA